MARAKLVATVGLKTGAFRRGLAQMRQMTTRFARRMKAIGTSVGNIGRVMRRGFLVGAAGIALAIREADQFRQKMGQVNTMLGPQSKVRMFGSEIKRLQQIMGGVSLVFKPKGGNSLGSDLEKAADGARGLADEMSRSVKGVTIQDMTKGVRKLSAELGIAKTELADGLYQTLSASIPPQNAISFLAEASKAAVGGATDVKTAVDGLTTVINAFGLGSADVTKVADEMFTAVKRGKTTFEELAQNIGQVANIASVAGAKTGEMFAAFATLTRQGVKTDKAVTGLRQAVIAFVNPSEEMVKVLDDLGMSGTQLIGKKGLVGAFEEVVKTTDGSLESIKKLFKNMRALPAVVGLTGANAKLAAEDIAAMEDAGGKSLEAFKKMEITRQWPRLWRSILGIVERVGDVISRTVQPAVEALSKKLQEMADSPSFNKFLERIGKATKGIVGGIGALMQGGEQKKLALSGFKDIIIGAFQIAGDKLIGLLLRAAPVIGLTIGQGVKKGMSILGDKSKQMAEAIAAGKESAAKYVQDSGGKARVDRGFVKIQKASDNFLQAMKDFASKAPSFVDEVKNVVKPPPEDLGGGDGGLGGAGGKTEQFSSLRRIGANIIAKGGARKVDVEKAQLTTLQKMLAQTKKSNTLLKARIDRRGRF